MTALKWFGAASPAAASSSLGGVMAKLIEVTLDNTNQVVAVNADKIVKFWRAEGFKYTLIELDGGVSMTVRESPFDIWSACSL
jgi:hypothetical protein